MDSLSQECNPLKHRYDACFNAWFEGYLQPVVASAEASSSASGPSIKAPEQSNADTSGSDPGTELENDAASASGSIPLSRSPSPTPSSASSSSSSSTTRRLRFPRTRRILTVLFGSAKKPFLSLREQGDLDHPDLWGHQPSRVLIAPGEKSPRSHGAEGGGEEEDEEEHDGPEEFDDLDEGEEGEGQEVEREEEDEARVVEPEKPTELTVQDRARMKADEYERNCGALFRDYRGCLQGAINNNQPLSALLDQARLENPLESAVPLSGGGLGAEGAEP